MSKVFLIQRTHDRDLSSANEYGTIVPIFGATEQPGNNPLASFKRVRGVLSEMDGRQDFICYAGGDWMGLLITGMVLASLGYLHKPYRYLRWERHKERNGTGFYVPVDVNMTGGDIDDRS